MKTINKIGTIALMLISINTSAQTVIGLYKTQNDFVTNKISYQIDGSSTENSIKVDNIFFQTKVVVKENGKKITFPKKDVFGYIMSNKKVYRFFNEDAYEILDITGFYLYKRNYQTNGKGAQRITNYYFSKDGADALQLLTKKNLETQFASNTKFIVELESSFHSDAELMDYVSSLKCFKLKYIYSDTAKK